jgi:hypothetical protein
MCMSGSYTSTGGGDVPASCCREMGPQMLVAPESDDDVQDQLARRASAASVGL